jgi:hypothetical protein
MEKAEFKFQNLQSGETWTFPTEEALLAFLKSRTTTALAGSGEPNEKVTYPEGWPEPAPLPEDYWETAQ